MKEKILKLLMEHKGEFLSGEEISNELGVSRTAIWKHMKSIRESGYNIESITRKGYRLIDLPDILDKEIVKQQLKTKNIGKKIIHFDSIGSTNDYAKQKGREEDDGTIIIAEEQTKGKGRMGRTWHSAKGDGIWMSIILKPNMSPYQAPLLTQIAGASLVKAFKSLGVDAKIKWPNDIYINDRKICGILTEMDAEINKINYIVLGIGMNVKTMEFPEDIKDRASSVQKEGYDLDRIDIIAEFINSFEPMYEKYTNEGDKEEAMKICKEESTLIGKPVYVIRMDKKIRANALDLSEDGNLVVEYEDGRVEEVFSGEVSIRNQ